MVKKFVPRQRKRKVLDRQRAQAKATRKSEGGTEAEADTQEDSNVVEILPTKRPEDDDIEVRKARLRKELRTDSNAKVSGKKAKRLEKYIETKLWKDENRALLTRLAANKIDTSLFASSRMLGQTRETRRQALRRALDEKGAGFLGPDARRDELLYERRPEVREVEDDEVESGGESDADEDDASNVSSPNAGAQSQAENAEFAETSKLPAAASEALSSVGSGLKRPLDVDQSGRPVLAKKQKRGGVQTKVSLVSLPVRTASVPEPEEWNGFSSDERSSNQSSEHEFASEAEEQNVSEGSADEDGISEDNAEDEGSSEESVNGELEEKIGDAEEEEEEDEEEEEEEEEEEDEDEDDARIKRKERSSAFKAWAHQQRNEALGYRTVDSGSAILEIPKPANFKPRPQEQDPLPPELLPTTTNVDRKAYSVTVTRDPEIQAMRLQLPVVAEEQRIMEAIHAHDVVVICGATGSGKTTQVPQFLYEAGYGSPGSPTPGLIGVTQPRRVAAVSMSRRVARELGDDRTHAVAYQIRFEGTVDAGTAVKFMTDGVLLREVARDIALRKYSAIIIDEAHERSVNTDILVGMLSRVVKLRADMAREDPSVKPLKLVIMSATLRIEDLTQNPTLFPTPPPVLEVEGRQHPVTVHFARRTHPDYVEEAFRKISRGHRKLPPGSFLVFLTGQNEILRLSKRLKSVFGGGTLPGVVGPRVRIPASEAPVEAEDVDFGDIDDYNAKDANDDDDEIAFFDEDGEGAEEGEGEEFAIDNEEAGTGPMRMQILPLYSLLPTKEQMRVFEPPPDGYRQVILATNVAETSLTIPGVRYVFDCGRAKERRYDRRTGVQSFEVGWISKASADQRSGRAGRTGPGHCYRLYSSAVYERDFPAFADPELLRMPIEGVVLQLKAMNLQHVVNFPFPTPPDRQSLVRAERLLTYLSAVTPSDSGGGEGGGRVTEVGKAMSVFPLAPRFARILLVGHLHGCLPYTVALVAGLSAGEVFIPESQALPAASASASGRENRGDNEDEDEDKDEAIRTHADVAADVHRAAVNKAYRAAHRAFSALDDRADVIKLLQAVGEFAHEPTEAWCASRFVRFRALAEAQLLRRQIADLLRAHVPAVFAAAGAEAPSSASFAGKLDPPTPTQVQALKQMVAAGFIDQVAIRADRAPVPPADLALMRKPRRAIDVPYLPLMPLDQAAPEDRLVYIHPSSVLAHLSVAECPEYVVYAHLSRASGADIAAAAAERKPQARPKTRMHPLTDVSGAQLAALAKGTPLLGYGKPIKEVKPASGQTHEKDKTSNTREVWVVPYLRAEVGAGGGGGLGWPLPARKVRQRRVPGRGWVVE